MPRDAHSAAKAVDMLDLLIEFFDDGEATVFRDNTLDLLIALPWRAQCSDSTGRRWWGRSGP